MRRPPFVVFRHSFAATGERARWEGEDDDGGFDAVEQRTRGAGLLAFERREELETPHEIGADGRSFEEQVRGAAFGIGGDGAKVVRKERERREIDVEAMHPRRHCRQQQRLEPAAEVRKGVGGRRGPREGEEGVELREALRRGGVKLGGAPAPIAKLRIAEGAGADGMEFGAGSFEGAGIGEGGGDLVERCAGTFVGGIDRAFAAEGVGDGPCARCGFDACVLGARGEDCFEEFGGVRGK